MVIPSGVATLLLLEGGTELNIEKVSSSDSGTFRIVDITEADFGCEERPEGAPLMCCLILEEENEPADGGLKQQIGLPLGRLRREIPDRLVDELGLVPGLKITGKELDEMQEGRQPQGWDALDRRHYYDTQIGQVCMSGPEYRAYYSKKSETDS